MVKDLILKWLRPNRLFPAATILTATTYLALALFKKVSPSLEEGLIIALLCLLSIDSLVERVSLLEKIEEKLEFRRSASSLRRRGQILKPDQFADLATTIHILVISGISIVRSYESFYKEKLEEGCDIHFILLDPFGDGVDAWRRQNLDSNATKHHIQSTLLLLHSLSEDGDHAEHCHVRLLDMFPPFSMVAVDLGKRSGKIVVEFHSYKTSSDQRAHIVVNKRDDPHWFNFYAKQLESAWEESNDVPWEKVTNEQSQA